MADPRNLNDLIVPLGLPALPNAIYTNYVYKAIPLAFDESESYYELCSQLLYYINDVIIPTVNKNAEALKELQEYVVELDNKVEEYYKTLDTKIDNTKKELQELIETTRKNLQDQIDTLNKNLTQEIEDRKSADDTLTENLNNEITNRTNADTSLQEQITQNKTDLSSEITNRTSTDENLQTQITKNKTDLETEITSRTEADNNLQTQIDNLENGQSATITEINQKIEQNATNISTEITDRKNADTDLQTQINNLSSGSSALSLKINAIINGSYEMTTNGYDFHYTNGHTLNLPTIIVMNGTYINGIYFNHKYYTITSSNTFNGAGVDNKSTYLNYGISDNIFDPTANTVGYNSIDIGHYALFPQFFIYNNELYISWLEQLSSEVFYGEMAFAKFNTIDNTITYLGTLKTSSSSTTEYNPRPSSTTATPFYHICSNGNNLFVVMKVQNNSFIPFFINFSDTTNIYKITSSNLTEQSVTSLTSSSDVDFNYIYIIPSNVSNQTFQIYIGVNDNYTRVYYDRYIYGIDDTKVFTTNDVYPLNNQNPTFFLNDDYSVSQLINSNWFNTMEYRNNEMNK